MGKTNQAWTTTHDTANRTMTHEFEFGFAVVVDFGNTKLKTLKNGVLLTSSDFKKNKVTLSDYEELLSTIESSVERLRCFDNGNSESTSRP